MSVPFLVLVDGQAPATDHGTDVHEQGDGTITEPRLYQLIRQRVTWRSARSRSRSSILVSRSMHSRLDRWIWPTNSSTS
jgi:hypothetical protein